jgi:hypothetical protein
MGKARASETKARAAKTRTAKARPTKTGTPKTRTAKVGGESTMTDKTDFSRLTPTDKISGEGEKDTRLLQGMAEEAGQYLLSFKWCKAILKGWFGWGVGGIAAVFLFEIEPATPNVDKILWVVVGDLPPAYMVTDELPTPLDALRTYIDLMEEWIAAVREGRPTEEHIPVNTAATQENADALETRLSFLKRNFLANQGA